ncbi:MAG: hypothetical protein J1E60_02410 [Christensenellaceae bacterium]|nr:hypothetical protein [Christensenellaceae bacterium]
MDGDLTEAISTRQEELRIVTEEWGDTTGESVDAIQREIARLTESIDNAQHRD